MLRKDFLQLIVPLRNEKICIDYKRLSQISWCFRANYHGIGWQDHPDNLPFHHKPDEPSCSFPPWFYCCTPPSLVPCLFLRNLNCNEDNLIPKQMRQKYCEGQNRDKERKNSQKEKKNFFFLSRKREIWKKHFQVWISKKFPAPFHVNYSPLQIIGEKWWSLGSNPRNFLSSLVVIFKRVFLEREITLDLMLI